MKDALQSVGTIMTDLNQRILHVDERYCEIIHRAPASLIGKLALSFTHTIDMSVNQPALDRLAVNGPGFAITKRYVRGDGSLVWVRNHVTRISDGIGHDVLCATSQPIARPFGADRLTHHYEAARRLGAMLISGRRLLGSDVIFAPGVETLLCLYRAEIEGRSVTIDALASLTGSAPSVMVRWVRLLQERGLALPEQPGPLDQGSCVRISGEGERRLDDLLVGVAG